MSRVTEFSSAPLVEISKARGLGRCSLPELSLTNTVVSGRVMGCAIVTVMTARVAAIAAADVRD